MALTDGGNPPERFPLFGAEVRDDFSWKFLLSANLLNKVAALVMTKVNASNYFSAGVMKKMFDWATAIVVNRSNARRFRSTVGGIRSVDTEHRSAVSRRQLRIDMHNFL